MKLKKEEFFLPLLVIIEEIIFYSILFWTKFPCQAHKGMYVRYINVYTSTYIRACVSGT